MNAKRKNTLRRLPPVTADEQAVADLIEKVRYLLEWMPICSIGSSGHLRRVAVEQAIAKLEGHTGRNMILAPLPAGVEDTPEVRRTLQAYVDGDQPAAKDKGTGWGGMHDPLPDSARHGHRRKRMLTVPKSLDQIIKDLQYLNEHRNAYTLRQLRDTLTELSKDVEAVADRLIL